MSLRTPPLPSGVARLQRAYRHRQLASDHRAGSWTRGKVRERWLFFVKCRWRLLTSMALAAGAPVALLTYLIPNMFLRGVIVGGGVVGTFAMLAVLVVQATGTATMSQGATAEQLTASELRPLVSRGWRLINHTSLRQWDIDHMLVGPAGVVCVETKWSSSAWKLDPPAPRVVEAIRQVTSNARDLRLLLRLDQVRRAVFVWTPHLGDVPRPERPADVDGTQIVIGGAAARRWRESLADAEIALSDEQIDAVWTTIDDHLRRRDKHEATAAPLPATFARAYWTVLGSVLAFIASVLVSMYAYTLTRSWAVWGAVAAVQLGAGLVPLTLVPRIARAAWLAGLFLMIAVAGIDWVL